MKIQLRIHKDDPEMIEIWEPWEIKGYKRKNLMAVIHIDSFTQNISSIVESTDEYVNAHIALD